MAPVRAAHRGNRRCMSRMGQPVVNGSTDLAALNGRFARAVMAGNQEQHALTAGNGLIETAVDREPGTVEVQPVKVEDTVRIDGAGAEPLVPSAIKCLVGDRNGFGFWLRRAGS